MESWDLGSLNLEPGFWSVGLRTHQILLVHQDFSWTQILVSWSYGVLGSWNLGPWFWSVGLEPVKSGVGTPKSSTGPRPWCWSGVLWSFGLALEILSIGPGWESLFQVLATSPNVSNSRTQNITRCTNKRHHAPFSHSQTIHPSVQVKKPRCTKLIRRFLITILRSTQANILEINLSEIRQQIPQNERKYTSISIQNQ